jgi:hypothetical protein
MPVVTTAENVVMATGIADASVPPLVGCGHGTCASDRNRRQILDYSEDPTADDIAILAIRIT